MRRPFPRGKRREEPVPTTDLDPAPTEDFHATPAERNAERARRARLARRAEESAATERAMREHTRKRSQHRTPAESGVEREFAADERARESADTRIRVRFTRTKETKGAVQFGEVDARGNLITDFKQAVVGSVYVRKDALDASGGLDWQTLTLTIRGE